MHSISILIVDDDRQQREAYSDAIEEYCERNPTIQINATFAITSEEGMTHLNEKVFDAVFIDLVLTNDGTNKGNEVIQKILESADTRLIVYVISGTLGALSSDLQDRFNSPLLKTFSRDTNSSEILDNVVKTYKTGVTKILGRQGILEQYINKIFFDHLARNFQPWLDKNSPCEKELLRWMSLHLLEYLDLPSNDSEADVSDVVSYFEPEFYIHPPIRKFFATGDIVTKDNKYFVLLSPACDIAVREIKENNPSINVESLVLGECIPLLESKIIEKKIAFNKWNDFASNMKRNNKNRFHYLPKYLDIPESVLDFKRLSSIPVESFTQEYSRQATISLPFIRDLQSRFSSYFARQGQPSGHWNK